MVLCYAIELGWFPAGLVFFGSASNAPRDQVPEKDTIAALRLELALKVKRIEELECMLPGPKPGPCDWTGPGDAKTSRHYKRHKQERNGWLTLPSSTFCSTIIAL